MNFEFSLSGKWLELPRDRAKRDAGGSPSGSRHSLRDRAVLRHQSAAPSLRMDVSPVNVRDAGEIERAVAAFARSANGGLIGRGAGWRSFIAI